MAESQEPLLRVEDLKVHFPVMQGVLIKKQVAKVHAVDGVSFTLGRGETLGLVGESGCGKSTTGLAVLRMLGVTSGRIEFEGVDITHHDKAQMRPLRRRLQMVYQDPYGSLNPRMKVSDIIGEPLVVHGLTGDPAQYADRIAQLMRTVGLLPDMADRYPHEFSGGQRQRIGIARALALEPSLLICDEPVSALDVSIQAQVVNVLQELQERMGLAYLFIAHDLAVVKHISNRVAVMYLGKLVEVADKRTLYARPLHPYTQALLSAIPKPDPTLDRQRIILSGDVPSPINPPPGCRFHTRCTYAQDRCKQEEPLLRDAGDGQRVACHFFETIGSAAGVDESRSSLSGKFAERLRLFEEAAANTRHTG